MKTYQTVLDFWFDPNHAPYWFEKSNDFDEKIRFQFLDLWQAVIKGECWQWRETIHGRLAEIIVLDQFSRNLCRESEDAFASDTMALVLAQEAVRLPAFSDLSLDERKFLLMPFMHSESKAVHEYAAPLFKKYTDNDTYEYERRHQAIINRFGHYPHRNEVRGRTSTPEEIVFLKNPENSF